MDNNILNKRTKGEWQVLATHTPDRLVKVFPETNGATYLTKNQKKRW